MPGPQPRLTVVVLTYNRKDEVLHTLSKLNECETAPPIIVVDNASTDGTEEAVRRAFPLVHYFALHRNIGTGARNVAAHLVTTPYIAFCDDDSWWEPASFDRAAEILDAHPNIALLQACMLVGDEGKLDPVCDVMARQVLPTPEGAPGPSILGFMAGSVVVRRDAFDDAGGFEQRFFIGGEEELLAADLDALGWMLCYTPELIVHHQPSAYRDPVARSWIQQRNALWFAWLRRPFSLAAGRTLSLAGWAFRDPSSRKALWEALRGLPWAASRRHALPKSTEQRLRLLDDRGK